MTKKKLVKKSTVSADTDISSGYQAILEELNSEGFINKEPVSSDVEVFTSDDQIVTVEKMSGGHEVRQYDMLPRNKKKLIYIFFQKLSKRTFKLS